MTSVFGNYEVGQPIDTSVDDVTIQSAVESFGFFLGQDPDKQEPSGSFQPEATYKA